MNDNAITLNNKQYAAQDLVGLEVVFPMSRSDCDTGEGIAVAALASPEAKEAFERGDSKGMFEVVLDSDALAEIGLLKGTVFPVELRGENRPIAPWGFAKKYR